MKRGKETGAEASSSLPSSNNNSTFLLLKVTTKFQENMKKREMNISKVPGFVFVGAIQI